MLNTLLFKKKLPPFFENLNTLLDKLCFYKFNVLTIKDLGDVLDWVDLGNKKYFFPMDLKISLFVFENSYQQLDGGSYRQRRRSMPLEKIVFDTFPVLFEKLISFIQLKMLTQHSEIKLGLVIKKFNESDRNSMYNKLKNINEKLKAPSNSITEFNQISISMQLYGEEPLKTKTLKL